MSEKITIEKLRELLNESSYRLQKLREHQTVYSDTYRLFDELAKEHHYMFSYVIDYLNQNR